MSSSQILSDYIFSNIETIKHVYPHTECVKLIGFIIQSIENSEIDAEELLKNICSHITNDVSPVKKNSTTIENEINIQSPDVEIVTVNVIEIINELGEKFYLGKENNVYTIQHDSLHLEGNIFELDKYLNYINTYTCDMHPIKTKNGTFYTDNQGKYFKKISNTTYIRVK